MSVMTQLKQFAENPDGSSGKFDRSFMEGTQGSENSSEMDEMMQDHPIPGQSLTQDPDTKLPMEGPPEFTDQQEFIDHLFITLSDEDILPGLLEAMNLKVPVEEVALKVLRGHIRKGKINTDLMLLCIEPTIYMLIAFATYAEIDPVLYPEGDLDDEEANNEMSSRFRKATQEMVEGGKADETPGVTVDELQAPTVMPKALMSRTQEAVAAVNQGAENGE